MGAANGRSNGVKRRSTGGGPWKVAEEYRRAKNTIVVVAPNNNVFLQQHSLIVETEP